MAGRRVRAFGELLEEPLRNGLNRPKKMRGQGVKMVNMGELFAHDRIGDVAMEYVPLSDAEAERFLLRPGDLLFARQSLVLDGAGKCSVFLGASEPVTYEGHIIRARIDSTTCDPLFYYYFFQSPEGRASIVSIVEQVAAAGIRGSDLARVSVPYPKISEQRAIAHILGTLDDKIELNRRMNETLEAMARAIFKSWFVDFDPVRAKMRGEQPAGLAPEIAALFPDALVETELGEAPEGWVITNLKSLFPFDSNCVITGPFGSNLHASDYREDGVPLLLVKNIVDGAIVEEGVPLVGWHKASELERYRLRLGDIVFTRVGAVGRSAYIHPRHVGWMISGQTLRVSISDSSVLHPRYLAAVFQNPSFTAMVESHALGTTRPSLNTAILEGLNFLHPSPQLQHAYAGIVTPFDERRMTHLDQMHSLLALRDTLLPKLISGELRVADAERTFEEVTQ